MSQESNTQSIVQLLFSGNIDHTDYGGINPAIALNNIKRRYDERKKGAQSDIKTAFVLQGGAMRGVFGAGVCIALEEIGYTEGFDEIYGTSAGAFNGSYFLSGQAAYGTTIYYKEINNNNFMNLLRFNKIVDIDFMMDVVTERKRLNIQKILNSSTVLNIPLTNVSTGNLVLFNTKSKNLDLLKILKAATAIPFVYNIPVNIDGVNYLDGDVSCPILIEEAIENGCTDILAVSTRPKNYIPKKPRGFLHRYFIRPKIQKHGENFYNAYMNKHKILAKQLSIIKGNDEEYREKNINIVTIFPKKSIKIKRMTKNEAILRDAAIEGAVKTLELFSVEDFHPTELLKFLNY